MCEVWLRLNGWRRVGAAGAWYERQAMDGQYNADFLLQCHRAPAATEVHHVAKRRGKMLLDENFWLAVCRENHERIEAHKSWARENGFLLNF